MSQTPTALLLRQISAAQDHVLSAVDGLDGAALRRTVTESGWSITGMLAHLTYDDEFFWVHAILAGKSEAIAALCDGWRTDLSDPMTVLARYRDAVQDSRDILPRIDFDAPPTWWPPKDVFPMPPYESGWQVGFHLLTEITTHAGHLDIVREQIDGRQHLTLS